MEFKWLENDEFEDHLKSLREEFRKVKSVDSGMILTLITPGMNHSWYHEPQLEKIDNRVNHNIEPRRPIKTYRIGSETLE
jgi:hypothetical protein